MVLNLHARLIAAFLAVTAIFACTGILTLLSLRQLNEHSTRMAEEYWPTADAIMEAEIAFLELRNTVFDPPEGFDRDRLIADLQRQIQERRQLFRQLKLAAAELGRIDALLQEAAAALATPLRLHGVPGERMEEADEAVQPVLAQARELGQLELVDVLWESVMAFNDYLITNDAEELEAFRRHSLVIEGHPGFATLRQSYLPYKEKALAVFAAEAEAQQARREFLRIGKNLSETLQRLERDYESTVVAPAVKLSAARATNTSRMMILSLLVGLIFSVAIGIFMARRIGGVVEQVLGQVQQIRDGSIDTRLHLRRRDELGKMAAAIDSMAERLTGVVCRIGDSSNDVGLVAGHLTKAAKEVEAGARRQLLEVKETVGAVRRIQTTVAALGAGVEATRGAVNESRVSMLQMTANIEEVANSTEQLVEASEEVHSSMVEMAASIREISMNAARLKESAAENAAAVNEMDAATRQIEERARQTATITEEVRRLAETGQQTVDQTIAGIGDIGQAMQATAEMTHALAADILNIDSILTVIDEITDQTALLALNAAIIAAQAGEHGSSFAVVASEIRQLSDRASHSTKEISQVLSKVRTGSANVVSTVEQAQKSVETGGSYSRHSGEALGRIVAGIEEVARQMAKIAGSTAEQTGGTRHLSRSVAGITDMAEQIAAAVAQQSKGGEQISAAAGRVQEITGQVRNATREQSLASRAVTANTEALAQMFERVEAMSASQQRESEAIAVAVGSIEESAAAGDGCGKRVMELVGQLAMVVVGLKGEVAYFERDEELDDHLPQEQSSLPVRASREGGRTWED